jgi:hypothetical protein
MIFISAATRALPPSPTVTDYFDAITSTSECIYFDCEDSVTAHFCNHGLVPGGCAQKGGSVLSSGGSTNVPLTSEEVPVDTRLKGNFPNPFSRQTTIEFQLAEASHVRISISDIWGRHIATLVDEIMGRGVHYIRWNGLTEVGTNVASGVYPYQLNADGYVVSRILTVIR